MAGKDSSYDRRGKKRKFDTKASKKTATFDGYESNKAEKFPKHGKDSGPVMSIVRKQVDPETVKYFTEISNVIEGSEVDLEERSVICGNALEEARGKEVELATDYILSHTMQTLLEGCSLDHLCGFLRGCANSFSHIATDKSGSHVAETALKSLSMHLEDTGTYSIIEETLTAVCKIIAANPVDIMMNCYGSHVLRSLLCLCRGVPLDSAEFHAAKSSYAVSERFNVNVYQTNSNKLEHLQPRFPALLRLLVSGMLDNHDVDLGAVQNNQFSSLVVQTALKLLADDEEQLLHIVPHLLGFKSKVGSVGNTIDAWDVQKVLSSMEETAFSHLMEVVLEVAPDSLYDEIFLKIFRNSVATLAFHQCGNFVVQALISHARTNTQMEFIWEEVGAKLMELLENGRSGVVASLVAACQKHHSNEIKCCQALAAAFGGVGESFGCIVPRILFLDNYFSCEDKSSWKWPSGIKMHVVGSLILQSIFKFPCEFIQTYIASLTSLEASQVIQTSQDPSGSRVIEAFLCSDASAKQKRKLVHKLSGHFGELSMHSSGSFTIEKSFNASNASLREKIVTELLPVQTELAKTRQGPYILRKLDVDGFSRRPDQWKLRQTSKQSAYKEFYDAFGPSERLSVGTSFLSDSSLKSRPEKLKDLQKEISDSLTKVAPGYSSQFLAHQGSKMKTKKSGSKRPQGAASRHKGPVYGDNLKTKIKKHKQRK